MSCSFRSWKDLLRSDADFGNELAPILNELLVVELEDGEDPPEEPDEVDG